MSVSSVLLGDARAEFLRRARALADMGDASAAYLDWICPAAVDDAPSGLRHIAARVSALSGAQRSFGSVAALGFAAASDALDALGTDALRSGVEWVTGRHLRVADAPTAILTDPVSVLGIALGARALAELHVIDRARRWVEQVVEAVGSFSGVPGWHHALLDLCTATLGGPAGRIAGDGDSADIRMAGVARGVLPPMPHEVFEVDAERLLEQVRELGIETLDPVRAAARAAALEWIFDTAPIAVPGRVSASDVRRLLRRVPAALMLWTWEARARTRNATARQWHVDNEYHVQNLLHLLLAPLFDDLLSEENLRSVGQKHPRPDLCVPSLRLVIEVKFVRESASFANVIEEVAADSALYFGNGSPYEQMIVFAWDDSRRSQEHDAFTRGVRSLPHIMDAVVVSRPGSWEPKGT